MNKDIHSEKNKLHKNKSRYNIYVFLVCLFFSSFIWLIIKFSQEYNVVVKIGIDYINVPKDKFITKADTSFSITLKANGLKLLTKKISKYERININLSNIKFNKNSKNHFFGNVELKSYVNNLVLIKFPFIKSVVSISPEVLSLEMDYAYSKKVPVKALYSYSLEKQYFLYGDIKIKPDSVYVFGSKSKIDKIGFIETDSIDFGMLNESVDNFLSLKSCSNFNYHISNKNVKIYIPVEKFTEKELKVPIIVPPNKLRNNIRIFPDNAKITFMVAIKDYKSITPDMFKISIDTLEMNNNTILPVLLETSPPFVKVNKIFPDEVEFIKIK